MTNRLRHWLAALAVVTLPACAPTGPTTVAHPPMWEVNDGDTRLILIGSVHRLPMSLDWSSGTVADAMAAADEAWLELSPEAMAGAAMQFDHMSRDEATTALAQRLNPRDSAAARRLAITGGLAADRVDATESWALAIAAGRGALAASDFDGNNGVETVVTRAMQARGKPVIGLETAADQFNAFDRLDAPVQDRLLVATTGHAATADADARELVAAWSRGDEAALTHIAADGLADMPELVEPLVHARNRRWATLLVQRMQRPGTIVVAVGTGHLVGEQSLPQLLRQHGFRVSRLPS